MLPSRLPVLVLMVTLAGCQGVDPFIATSQTLNQVGVQFVEVGTQMNRLYDAGQVDKETYRKWRDFAIKFKVSYPLACASFDAAVAIHDATKAGLENEKLSALARELAQFAVMLVQTARALDGAP